MPVDGYERRARLASWLWFAYFTSVVALFVVSMLVWHQTGCPLIVMLFDGECPPPAPPLPVCWCNP